MKLFAIQNQSLPPRGRWLLDCAGKAQRRRRFRVNTRALRFSKAAPRFAGRRSPKWFPVNVALVLFMMTARFGVLAAGETNAAAPVTARDFYNAGTELLAAGKFAGAEQMFQSALAAQDERVQPPALYNLGHARFAEGDELLKKGPDAQKAATQGDSVSAAGGKAIQSAQSALDENDLSKMIAAYVEGRGVRHQMREVEKAVREAMETYGNTLRKWRRAADDFKSAAELNPADTNATRNAELLDQRIARLVDRLQKMQAMSAALAGQHQQMNDVLNQLKGRIPQDNMPPGAAGDDDDEDVLPGSLAGQKENPSREGDQMQVPLSPAEAGEILDGLSLDGRRRLLMSDQQGGAPKDKKGRDW
jgi:tetratricopeptide (TPR) repeat protein